MPEFRMPPFPFSNLKLFAVSLASSNFEVKSWHAASVRGNNSFLTHFCTSQEVLFDLIFILLDSRPLLFPLREQEEALQLHNHLLLQPLFASGG